jgi:uncharacterized repeat protein (TIGR03943 family)
MNFSEFNKNARLLTLFCICIGLFSSIVSGTILTFLHPRSLLFVKITWVILVILTLSDLHAFTKSKEKSKLDWRFFAMLFPIALFMIVKPTGLSSRIAVQKGLSSLSMSMQSNQQVNEDWNTDDSILYGMSKDLIPEQKSFSSGTGNTGTRLDKTFDNDSPNFRKQKSDSVLYSSAAEGDKDSIMVKVKDTIAIPNGSGTVVLMHSPELASISDTLREDSLYVHMDRIYSNPQSQRGRKITMVGFIAPDTVLGRNSFFIARMMISCCAADAMPLGFYCITDSVLGVKENDWVILTGTIEARSIKLPWNEDNRTLPILRDVSVVKTVAPRNEYIYPVAY